MKKLILLALMALAITACTKSPIQIDSSPQFKQNSAASVKQNSAPNISYPSKNNLTVGKSVTIKPTNKGGAVPAIAYGQVTTFVGSTTSEAGYINATGTSARFQSTQQMALDASGNLYVTDAFNHAIRKVSPSGVVTTFAGSTVGIPDFKDGADTSARFNYPDGIAIDATGNLFVADYNNNAIRKITPGGMVSTFYSSLSTFGPNGIFFDPSGNLLVTAADLAQILKITPAGVVTVVAGSTGGYTNATGTAAQFDIPTDITMDASGNMYVVDFVNQAIRKITPAGVVTTFAGSTATNFGWGYADGVGTAALFNWPIGCAMAPGGVLYIADTHNNDIRRIMPDGTVSFVAGSATQAIGDADGTGAAARFNWPDYITLDGNGSAYVSEWAGNRVRKLVLTGYSLTGTLPAGLSFDPATGIISGTPTTKTPATIYTITAFNTKGFSATSVTIGIN